VTESPLTADSDAEKERITRHSPVSLTSLSFLTADRSHMLVTGCDASAAIRVWDIRTRYSRRPGSLPVPVSTTAVPSDHLAHAYSTAHLILGHAPELDPPLMSSASKTRFSSDGRPGLGPLYGFRNKNFQVGSFYVKAAVRPVSCGKPEMLAVGSSSSCAMLFPTDERDFLDPEKRRSRNLESYLQDMEIDDSNLTPMYEVGTSLTNGHDREVAATAWTCDGDLVTSADDKVSRVWRENPLKARLCRERGLRDAETATCGWADVEVLDDEYMRPKLR
jgi:WD40 repeat protein